MTFPVGELAIDAAELLAALLEVLLRHIAQRHTLDLVRVFNESLPVCRGDPARAHQTDTNDAVDRFRHG
jgi:hypothetical protein